MTSSQYQTPDLAAILRTLAALGPAAQQGQTSPPDGPDQEDDPYDPTQPQGQHSQQSPQPSWNSRPSTIVDTKPKPIDPSTIIDWSAGLRCVMRTVSARDNVIKDIRKMLEVQHEHEEQWWRSRQALVEKQEARKDGQQQLEDVLRAVGASSMNNNTKTGPEANADELRTYDLKVYRAQHQMVKEMSARLKALGIPFFGTRTDLVRVPGKDDATMGKYDGTGEEKRRIDEADLVKLQKKMLELLEDMCKD